MPPTNVDIPYNFTPRDYQRPVFEDFDRGIKRFCLVWARRHGKDKTAFNLMVKAACQRVGVYYYMFPTYSQGKKALWNQIGKDGFPGLGHVAKELIERKNSQEMMIVMKNGSIIQVVGTDNMDSIVGTNPVGMVFSEFSVQTEAAWNFMRPILYENDGWALFNGTPRGRNHFFEMRNYSDKSEEWHFSIVTNADTGIMTLAMLAREREEGMTDDMIDQEYFCSFIAQTAGFYYQKDIETARSEGRIGKFDYNPNLLVTTSWDLGFSDNTTIWFCQYDGSRIVWFDYFEDSGKNLKYYAAHLADTGYRFARHCLPHDADHKKLDTGLSTQELLAAQLEDYDVSGEIDVADRLSVQAGINTVRSRFSRFYFNEELCGIAIDKLGQYHAKYDEKRKMVLPVHDKDTNSDTADGLRTESLLSEDMSGYGNSNSNHQAPAMVEESSPFEGV